MMALVLPGCGRERGRDGKMMNLRRIEEIERETLDESEGEKRATGDFLCKE